jgi:3',5'-cyclic AMP phosphodiesterase CpdA
VSETVTFVQISDPHLMPEPGERYREWDTDANLRRTLAYVGGLPTPPAFLLVSGDLVHEGPAAGYRRLRAILAEGGANDRPLFIALGNHDRRGPFREGFLDQPPSEARYYYRAEAAGLRLLVLDSRHDLPTDDGGDLDDAQLTWLERELAEPHAGGTLVVVHHPPIACPVERLNAIGLASPERLASAIAGRDVVGVLCGHIHFAHAGALAGVPVATAPATSALIDPGATDAPRFVAGVGFNLVQVRDGRMTVSPILLPPAAG